jgi:hypothetical protein
MKTSTLLKSALSIALVSVIIFSCKKKEDTAPEDSNTTTTGGTTGGGTTGGTTTPSVNFVTISGGSTYTLDSLQVGGYTGATQTYRQRGMNKTDLNTGLIIDMYGSLSATTGTYNISNSGYNNGQAYMSLGFPNGSGGVTSVIGTSGTMTASIVGGKFTTVFNNAIFQSSGGWPISTFTVSGSLTNP